MKVNTEKQIQSELSKGIGIGIGIVENVELDKHRENLRTAQMNTLEYGEEVVLISNSKKEELYDYLLGSIGTIVQRNKAKNNTMTTNYIVMFGDLKVDVDVKDIRLRTELEGL